MRQRGRDRENEEVEQVKPRHGWPYPLFISSATMLSMFCKAAGEEATSLQAGKRTAERGIVQKRIKCR
eukprot:5648958-Amphidinium_carterae.1